ncbi:Aste57867_22378 [Aphanomyces stellatus]|uniref:Aste57867_22378 protein n=1 Tax=Aphanomyces stellatus TaxID=120398 RepID=A0A485LK44_9STRA|nr:hypothetical protein As57867_022308 [Aphanomyces stellatus]VFT99041.1 Aste57867_22378 [Aphanomyces stellatus]
MFRSSIGAFRAYSVRGPSARVFPQFSVYGSDALFQLSPIAPVYTNAGKYLKQKRGGAIMLSWCKATSSGYNYQEKHFFSLTPAEIGALLNTLDTVGAKKLTLVHSPNANAPQPTDAATKSFIVEFQAEQQKTVFEFSSDEARAAVALSLGELRVVKELLQYSVPRLLGFHSVLEGDITIDNEGAPVGGGGGNSYGAPRYNKPKPTSGGDWPF